MRCLSWFFRVESCLPYAPRIRSAVAGPVQGRPGLVALVPRNRAVRADDGLLVALAGQQDDVARAGALDRGLDGGAPVGDDQEVVIAPLAGRLRATGDLVEDRLTILAARVLVGDDDDA